MKNFVPLLLLLLLLTAFSASCEISQEGGNTESVFTVSSAESVKTDEKEPMETTESTEEIETAQTSGGTENVTTEDVSGKNAGSEAGYTKNY